METITKYLQDPGWWFSAFFVAIIASVIAGFLKERIERWLGRVFSGLKAWRAEKESQRGKIIEALIKDQTYFMIALVRAMIALILFTITALLYFAFPIQLMTAPASSWSFGYLYRDLLVWNFIVPVLGLFNVFVGYRTARRLSIIKEAIRVYIKRNDLPKLF